MSNKRGWFRAGCFLFIQNAWKIPGNNLFLSELLLLMCLFYISFHPSSHYAEHARRKYTTTRFLEFSFTLPLLSVASAGAAGLTDITDMGWIFFSSLFASLFILCIEFHNHKKAMQGKTDTLADMRATNVLLLNVWLCVVAFLMEYIPLLSRATTMQQRPWAIAAAVLTLLYHLTYALGITVYHLCFSLEYHHQFIFCLDWLGVIGKYAVTMTLMVGMVAALDP